MLTFAIICGAVLWAALVVGLSTGIISSIRSTDWECAGVLGFGLIFVLGLTALGYSQVQEDNKNPCVAWGPPETSMMLVGKVFMPVTNTPCIRRQNETER